MATLIPYTAQIAGSVPPAHRYVAAALAAGMSAGSWAWYEAPFAAGRERPHFVVVDPALGVMVMMILEGATTAALQAFLADGGTGAAPNPLDPANHFGLDLKQRIKDHDHLDGVPVSGVAVFAELEREHAEVLGVESELDLNHCLFASDLQAVLAPGAAAGLFTRFADVFDEHLEERLTEGSVSELRELIHADAVIDLTGGSGVLFSRRGVPSDGPDDAATFLTADQESAVKDLGPGHRMIRGASGSGKTLVLAQRARRLADARPEDRILVTCANTALATALQAELAEHPNVVVSPLPELMRESISAVGWEELVANAGGDSLPYYALEAVRANPRREFRSILVDDAQRFDAYGAFFCLELFDSPDPAQQDLLLFVDATEAVAGWTYAGLAPTEGSLVLRENFRNTAEIAGFAREFLFHDPSLGSIATLNGSAPGAFLPAGGAARSGPTPSVEADRGVDSEIEEVVEQVATWHSDDLGPRSIAVLMAEPTRWARAKRIVSALEKKGITCLWLGDPDEAGNEAALVSTDATVVVSSIDAVRGFDFPKVVVCGLGGWRNRRPEPTLEARQLLCAGFMRATDELSVVTTYDNPFRSDLPGLPEPVDEQAELEFEGEFAEGPGEEHDGSADELTVDFTDSAASREASEEQVRAD